MLHHLIGKDFRKKGTALPTQLNSLSSPWESQHLNPVQTAQRGLLLAGLQSGKPSECHSHMLTEQTCSYAVIMAIFTNGVTIVEKSETNPSNLIREHRKLVCWQMIQVPLPDERVRKIFLRCAYITEDIKEKIQHRI